MGAFFKKDFLVYWRDRKEMLVALITPIIIIMILSFALPNWVENSSGSIALKVALVNDDEMEVGLRQFKESLADSALPTEAVKGLSEEARTLSPEVLLMDLFSDEQIKGIIEVQQTNANTAISLVEKEDVDAIITIPEGATLKLLNKLLLNQGDGTVLQLSAKEASSNVNVIENILHSFTERLNYEAALNHAKNSDSKGDPVQGSEYDASAIGGLEQVERLRVLTSFQYYAVAITIFFALTVSVTTGMKSITEKRELVFMRILMSGAHPLRYLAGKVASTFCMALLQFVVLMTLSHFIFNLFPDRSLEFWGGMALVSIVYCLSVAALSSVYTAIFFRVNDVDSASGIVYILLIVFGAIGGSLIPLYILPEWLMTAGTWTPNGMALSTFIPLIQGAPLRELWLPIASLVIFTIIVTIIGSWIFPKRGRI